ncbi:alpha/beta hydrolase [Clostridium sp. YIM B02515]|uniref:Alpha/beta hydrolase n=1 Tax=Clostridium rhizosphaerae TaxID=2803861 RepID=A0ABS1T5M3_9CLOT|nr:alpha/beta hydrolase-fold protein [Clostridium rhizosphaerae]MBL4934635.1 alpha/beta hydrolase [Clostridium rhizosphaerae]
MHKTDGSEVVFIKNFESRIMNNKRDIAVYLPESYKEDDNRSYPVLYMHDGQNLFTGIDDGSDIKWRVKETTDRLIKENKIQDIIIVGIYNNERRINEYTTSYVEKFKSGGRGGDYASFIIQEIKPYIDSNYRTLKDRYNTAIAGSSLGGLISFYIGWNYSDVFKKIGAISPSFWWNSCEIIKEIEKYNGDKKDLKIWIDAGTAEETSDRNNNGVIDMVDDARDMVSVLNKKGLKPNEEIMYLEVNEGKHNEKDWAERFDKFLIYMFSK